MENCQRQSQHSRSHCPYGEKPSFVWHKTLLLQHCKEPASIFMLIFPRQGQPPSLSISLQGHCSHFSPARMEMGPCLDTGSRNSPTSAGLSTIPRDAPWSSHPQSTSLQGCPHRCFRRLFYFSLNVIRFLLVHPSNPFGCWGGELYCYCSWNNSTNVVYTIWKTFSSFLTGSPGSDKFLKWSWEALAER